MSATRNRETHVVSWSGIFFGELVFKKCMGCNVIVLKMVHNLHFSLMHAKNSLDKGFIAYGMEAMMAAVCYVMQVALMDDEEDLLFLLIKQNGSSFLFYICASVKKKVWKCT